LDEDEHKKYYATVYTNELGQVILSLPLGKYKVVPVPDKYNYTCSGVEAIGCDCSRCKCNKGVAYFSVVCECKMINLTFICTC